MAKHNDLGKAGENAAVAYRRPCRIDLDGADRRL